MSGAGTIASVQGSATVPPPYSVNSGSSTTLTATGLTGLATGTTVLAMFAAPTAFMFASEPASFVRYSPGATPASYGDYYLDGQSGSPGAAVATLSGMASDWVAAQVGCQP
jgi:hypothetical protein